MRECYHKGLSSQVVATEGYGEQYATKSESSSDSERAVDRDIALRFVNSYTKIVLFIVMKFFPLIGERTFYLKTFKALLVITLKQIFVFQ